MAAFSAAAFAAASLAAFSAAAFAAASLAAFSAAAFFAAASLAAFSAAAFAAASLAAFSAAAFFAAAFSAAAALAASSTAGTGSQTTGSHGWQHTGTSQQTGSILRQRTAHRPNKLSRNLHARTASAVTNRVTTRIAPITPILRIVALLLSQKRGQYLESLRAGTATPSRLPAGLRSTRPTCPIRGMSSVQHDTTERPQPTQTARAL